MASAVIRDGLKSFADVDIDESGTFKYILIKLTDRRSNSSKFIVRGYSWASYHGNIYGTMRQALLIVQLTFKIHATIY